MQNANVKLAGCKTIWLHNISISNFDKKTNKKPPENAGGSPAAWCS